MDMKLQRAETAKILADLATMEDMPREGLVAFQFVMDDGRADWDALADAAEIAGYGVEFYEAVDDEDEDVAEITTSGPIPLTFDSLWAHEERLTLMAAMFGFAPDGWAFAGNGAA